MLRPCTKDRLLDFQDVRVAITNTSITDPTLSEGIRFRKYNSKTGEFTSRENSSDDDSDGDKEHEATLR